MALSDNDSVVSDGQMSVLSDDSIAESVRSLPQLPSPSTNEYIPTLLEVRPYLYRLRLYADVVVENSHS